MISAANEFFQYGRLLKQFNSTFIALIPKVQHPTVLTTFRPISCCDIIHKCIAKILANRLRLYLSFLISWNQSAFIQDRRIMDNIFLAREVVKDYHKPVGKPRCTIEIDLKRAFDSVHWNFVLNILRTMGFPSLFMHWLVECLTTSSFSIKIDRKLRGFSRETDVLGKAIHFHLTFL